MRDGFFKTALACPAIRPADVQGNTKKVIALYEQAAEQGAKLIVFPELVLTGYTCQDLFLQDELLAGTLEGLKACLSATGRRDSILVVGAPLEILGKLYNCAVFLQDGEILAVIPKRFLPNYGEFYEARHFAAGPEEPVMVQLLGRDVPFGSNLLLNVDAIPGLVIGAEICEDGWAAAPPSEQLALSGAVVIANLSASNEIIGKDDYRKTLFAAHSGRLICGYLYVSAGDGESTQDLVFGGRLLAYENGSLIAERRPFDNAFGEDKLVYADLDIKRLLFERRRQTTFAGQQALEERAVLIPVHMERTETPLTRDFDPHPFVPHDTARRQERCELILQIQARGLAKRLAHTNSANAVIGISGGLDSTLALLVAAKAFDILGLDRKGIRCVTMPCFGTTGRTLHNACTLSEALGGTLQKVDIRESVLTHFRDIGQDPENHDVTYENGQARERTQVLMDIANKCGGLVIGTGDLSELALGWATYNGDHMSMYGVNAGIPKTLVSHLVRYYADTCGEEAVRACLLDVLDTPVSPELLPPTANGTISQKTEDLVGPYELHDFFLYYMLRLSFTPAKIYRIAKRCFAGTYDAETILKWERTFYRRFFAQQFKRSCLPDAPKVGSVAVSPRGDLRMPSDAVASLWLSELEELKTE